MDYDTIAQIFLVPPAEPVLQPVVPSTPARRLRDALEPIATQGWWSRPAAERVTALGLGFFDGYVWGRAAALGEPTASVVVSAFGVFEPVFLTAVYNQGRAVAARADVLAARELGATESLTSVLGLDRETVAADVADTLLNTIAPPRWMRPSPLQRNARAVDARRPVRSPVARRRVGARASWRRAPRGLCGRGAERGRDERPHGTVARLRPSAATRRAVDSGLRRSLPQSGP